MWLVIGKNFYSGLSENSIFRNVFISFFVFLKSQVHTRPTSDHEVSGSTPAWSATFLRGDWSWIFYGHTLPLIQEGQLSVSGERMCAILVMPPAPPPPPQGVRGGVPVPLFPWKKSAFPLFLQIKILIFCSLFPQISFVSLFPSV